MRCIAFFVIPVVVVMGCTTPAKTSSNFDGVYMMCKEVTGYEGETLELQQGQFRYWHFSDAVSGREPLYPLTGTYTVQGEEVVLHHDQISNSSVRIRDSINNVLVLWTQEGQKWWHDKGEIWPYSVLIKVSDRRTPPSIQMLKDPPSSR